MSRQCYIPIDPRCVDDWEAPVRGHISDNPHYDELRERVVETVLDLITCGPTLRGALKAPAPGAPGPPGKGRVSGGAGPANILLGLAMGICIVKLYSDALPDEARKTLRAVSNIMEPWGMAAMLAAALGGENGKELLEAAEFGSIASGAKSIREVLAGKPSAIPEAAEFFHDLFEKIRDMQQKVDESNEEDQKKEEKGQENASWKDWKADASRTGGWSPADDKPGRGEVIGIV